MRASISFIPLSRRAAVLTLLLFVAAVAYSQITPSQDAYTNSAAPTTNYGSAVTLGVVNSTASIQTTYIQFDLSSIPAGYKSSNITKATLKLYVNTVTTAGSFNVDFVNGTWTEKKITSSLPPALGAPIVSSVPLTSANVKDYVLVDITAAVGAWLDGTLLNDGIALVANSPLSATFDSKENTAQSQPAEIDIVYAGIAGVATASGSGLTGGGTSGTLNLSLTNACAANQILQWNGTAWACANLSAGGTVTSVALTAPSTDFLVTGSPVTSSGTLGLGWLVAPDFNNTPNAIVKRDSSGNFTAGTINAATGFNLSGTAFAFGSYANYNAFLGFAGNTTTTGQYNTAIGVQALLMNTTGIWNTAIGAGALLSNSTGTFNTATGPWTLTSNTTGEMNTATGSVTLNPNTTGSNNTATGAWALGANTTGSSNTASGFGALISNTTGSNNTASGINALDSSTTGNSNTASGSAALYSNTTGGNNTADGQNALYSNTTGWQNTADGYQALYNNTTGSNNTALGYGSGPDASYPNLTNATAIGAFADVTQNNSLVLGSILGVNNCTAQNNCTSTNVGIGTTAPQYALDVHGTGNFTGPVTFAPGQTFPGTGTITGVTAGTDLKGGGTTGKVTLNVDTTKVVTGITAGTDLTGGGTGGVLTLNLDTTKVPRLAAVNTFTGAQTVNGNVAIIATGTTLTASGGSTGMSGAGSTYGVLGQTGTNGASGVNGSDSSSSGGYGVSGASANGCGVYGTAGGYGITPCTSGVVGVNGSSSGTGVEGYGGSTGVYGSTIPSGNTGYGVVGQGNVGVWGVSQSTSGYGVYGLTYSSSGYGVYGKNSTGSGYAGYFQGNVDIVGTLSKTSGSFKIDHPLDPANKYLYHSFVESPDMMNIYNGNVILDKDGTAWITLPDYFGALNRDFRYQLTAVGAPGPNLYIAQEIANNRFQIAGGTPGGKVSWQVTGIRQDAFAKAHPIIPEVEKTGEERGKYLHPVEHGQPKSMGIDESRRAKMLALHPEPAKLPEQAVLPEPPKLAPPMLPQQPPVPAPPRTRPPVSQQHVAVPEVPK